jgi:hypothetical protein
MPTAKSILFSFILLTGTVSAQTYRLVSSGKLAGSAGSAMTLYDVYEIIATRSGGSAYGNPWTDAKVSATFTDPSSGTHVINGFLYASQSPYEYHVRFAPRQSWGTGTYTWTLTWDGNNIANGTFAVTAGTNQGFLAPHSSNPYSVITENNGKFFYSVGFPPQQDFSTSGSVATWTVPSGDYGTYALGISSDSYFSQYAAAGGHLYRSNGESVAAHELNNFNDGTAGAGKYTTRLDYGLVLDDVVEHARNYDVHILWTPIYDPANYNLPNYDVSNTNVRNAYLGYWNYVVNRYGAFVDIWEYYNEGSPSINNPSPAAFQNALSNNLIANDPYGHFRSPGGFELANPAQNTNFSAPHHYWTDAYSYLDNSIVTSANNNGGGAASYKAAAPNIPFMFGETGNGNSAAPADCADQTRYRTMVYTTLFNQGTGMAFWDNGVWGNCGNFYSGGTTRGYALALWNFVQTYWDATATPKGLSMGSQATTSGYAIGNSAFLAVYARTLTSSTIQLHGKSVTQGDPIAGNTFTVTVPASGMTAQWVSLVDGTTVGSTFTPAAGSQQFTVPSLPNDPSNGHPPPDVVLVMSSGAAPAAPPPAPPAASACDLNGDGVVNQTDVNVAISQALGVSVCGSASLSGSGSCSVVDVQRIVNAALGGPCRVGP